MGSLRWFNTPEIVTLLTFAAAVLGLGVRLGQGDILREDFDTPQTSWQLVDGDCRAVITRHQRSFLGAHSGDGCERITIRAGNGTYVHFGHKVGMGRVIDELKASVWVRSNRPGIQLLARVVFPRTANSTTGRPVTTLIRGSSYSNIGDWQQLTLRDTPLLVQRQLRILRAELGSQIDPREAYVDLLLLNGYGGRGSTDIFIDSMEIEGLVEAAADAVSDRNPAPVQLASALTPENMSLDQVRQHETIRLDGSILLVDGRPKLPRIIEHQGEPFESLGAIGFNTISLRSPPSKLQLAEANRLGLWLTAPPPQRGTSIEIDSTHRCVLAWDLGRGLSENNFDSVRQLAEDVRRADPQPGRPLMCHAVSALDRYSRLGLVLRTDRLPLGTSFELSEFDSWIRDRIALCRPGTPIWAAVQTDPTPSVVQQLSALNPTGQLSLPSVEDEQIEMLTLLSAAAGARAMIFRSHSRLDANNDNARHRSLILTLVNQQLSLFEPWLAAGTRVSTIQTSDRNVRLHALTINRSRLMLLVRNSRGGQYSLDSPPEVPVSFVVPGIAGSSEVYQITPTRIIPVKTNRVTGGIRISAKGVHLSSVYVLTEDPLVVSQLTKQQTRSRELSVQLRRQLAENTVTKMEQFNFNPSLRSHIPPSAGASLNRARNLLAQMRWTGNSNDLQAVDDTIETTMRAITRYRRSVWEHATEKVQQPTASPFLVGFDTLPAHWKLTQYLPSANEGANSLAAGNFESLDHMYRNGWRHYRYERPGVDSDVELTPRTPKSGRFALRIRAWSTEPEGPPAVVESPPVWITSAPISVQRGQILRIQGWIELRVPVTGSLDGLLIYDSIGKQSLGLRFRQTGGWQPFVMYRVVDRTEELTLTFALSGFGEAVLDEVTVTPLSIPNHPERSEPFGQLGNADRPTTRPR